MSAAPTSSLAAAAAPAPAASAAARRFTSPSGRTWTASVVAGAHGAPVLRFQAGDVVLDLGHVPRGWEALPDGALVDLVRRATPPAFPAPPAPAGEEGPPVAAELRAPRPVGAAAAGSASVESFADRMAVAFLALQVRHRGPEGRLERVSPNALAEMVAARLAAAGHPRAVEGAEVVAWFADALPDLHTTLAIAEACGVDPGWLAFGAASSARVPVVAPNTGAGSHRTPKAPKWNQPHRRPDRRG